MIRFGRPGRARSRWTRRDAADIYGTRRPALRPGRGLLVLLEGRGDYWLKRGSVTGSSPLIWFCAWQSRTHELGPAPISTPSSPMTNPTRPPGAMSQAVCVVLCRSLVATCGESLATNRPLAPPSPRLVFPVYG